MPVDTKPPPPILSSPATSSHNSPLANVSHFRTNNTNTNTKVPPPPPPPVQQSQNAIPLGELDPDSVPANMKTEGSDWLALHVS